MAETTSPEAIAILDQYVRQGHHRFTLNEASAMTGIAIDTVRQAMIALLTTYTCRLQVSEQGDLVYDFGRTLHRRGQRNTAERWRQLRGMLWKAFTVVYKALIAIFLVFYFVLSFIALLIFASGRSNDRYSHFRPSSTPSQELVDIFLPLSRKRRYGEEKSFVQSVYDFVFGPPRAAIDPLAMPREVASFLRRHKGLVVPAELCALAGCTFAQAECLLSDCVIRYHGDVHISDHAVLYGQFDDLMRGVGEVESGSFTSYWDKYDPEYELTGNSDRYNGIIGVMNGCNLVLSGLILKGLSLIGGWPSLSTLGPLPHRDDLLLLIPLVFGWLPLIFSVLFFLIPLARGVHRYIESRQRRRCQIRKRMYKAIFACHGAAQSVDDMTKAVNSGVVEAPLSRSQVETELKALALDLSGEMSVTESGAIEFVFPRITAELAGVATLRRSHVVDRSIGDIVMESDN